jgi:hypothetical protein
MRSEGGIAYEQEHEREYEAEREHEAERESS